MPDTKRIYYSALCQKHQVSAGHPERPERLQALVDFLQQKNRTDTWQWIEPQEVAQQWFTLAHPQTYVHNMFALLPKNDEPLIYLDGDTCWSAQSGKAVSLAGGALQQAIDWSMQLQANTIPISFCLSRPPGHHAERTRAMGFCIFSLVACAAIYAQENYALERVAILDFDVHHGNGTEDALQDYPSLFFASSFQQDIFPAGATAQKTAYRRCLPMPAGIDSHQFRELWDNEVFPALRAYKPQLIVVSAGFDAHHKDPLANCSLVEQDFSFLGQRIKEIATQNQAPIVANLEGGYDLQALAQSAYAFMQGMS